MMGQSARIAFDRPRAALSLFAERAPIDSVLRADLVGRLVALGATVEEVEWKPESLGEATASFAEEHNYYFLNDASDELVPVGTATIAIALRYRSGAG